MQIRRRATKLLRTLRHPRRRVWAGPDRVHIGLLELPAKRREACIAKIEKLLTAHPAVEWARVNRQLQSVIVAHHLPEASAQTLLLQELTRIEHSLGLSQRRYARELPEHPGDFEPILRSAVQMGADLASLVAGFGMKLTRFPRLPIETDLAAGLSVLEGVPPIREGLEERLGPAPTDLVVGLSNALAHALLQSSVGPAVDLVHRYLRMREASARRELWDRREPELCSDPGAHEFSPYEVAPRPTPLRRGPIENYNDKAVPGSLLAFGLALITTRSLSRSTVGLFGGLPKPARLGRDAFTAHLGKRLAGQDIVVMNGDALARLDRIDILVVQGNLLSAGDGASHTKHNPLAEAISKAAKAARVQFIATAEAGQPRPCVEAEQLIAGGPCLVDEIRGLQIEGHGVAFVGRGPSSGFAAADLSLGLPLSNQRPPWQADLIGKSGLGDALTLIEAICAARENARHAVYLSTVEAASAALIAIGGARSQRVGKVRAVANVTALMSMLNAVRLAQGVSAGRQRATQRDETPWHTLRVDDVLQRLKTGAEGLATDQAQTRRPPQSWAAPSWARWGPLFIDEISNPLAPLVAAGAGISALKGALVDAGMLSGVVTLNALLGAGQRLQTERLLSALGEDERAPIRVRRDRRTQRVDPVFLVVGDLVELDAGEEVPADCRVIDSASLEVDESRLTGESRAVPKQSAPLRGDDAAGRSNMLYAGTTITAGSALAVIIATGTPKEAGGLFSGLRGSESQNNAERRLESLAARIGAIAALSGLTAIGAGLMGRRPPAEVISAGTSLALAAVPKNLPSLATLAQLSTAGRLSKRGVLIRNRQAVETLARVDVLCTQRLETVTKGALVLDRVWDGQQEWAASSALEEAALRILAVGRRTCAPHCDRPLTHVIDRALVDTAIITGVDTLKSQPAWEHLHEVPLTPGGFLHANIGRTGACAVLSVKGAPEAVLPRCTNWELRGHVQALDPGSQRRLLADAEEMAARGLRVVAVAERHNEKGPEISKDQIQELTLLGFVVFSNPTRASARQAIHDLRSAGIETLLITGDPPNTAQAIARSLELPRTQRVVTGSELDAMTDAELEPALGNSSVFASVDPAQKTRLVRALQQSGRTVALTTDRAADAPALRVADAGIAMGERVPPALRRAADIVLEDEKLTTLVESVLETRAVWAHVRDAVSLLVGGNLGEIGFTLAGSSLDGRSPLNARQLMLVNLLTDALPAAAIAMRPPSRPSPEQLLCEGPDISLGSALSRDIVWRALITGGSTAGAWVAARAFGTRARADTVALLTLAGSQLGQTLVTGGNHRLVLGTSLGSFAALATVVQTPVLSHFFGCRPLGPLGLAQAGAFTLGAMGASTLVPIARHWFDRAFEPDTEAEDEQKLPPKRTRDHRGQSGDDPRKPTR